MPSLAFRTHHDYLTLFNLQFTFLMFLLCKQFKCWHDPGSVLDSLLAVHAGQQNKNIVQHSSFFGPAFFVLFMIQCLHIEGTTQMENIIIWPLNSVIPFKSQSITSFFPFLLLWPQIRPFPLYFINSYLAFKDHFLFRNFSECLGRMKGPFLDIHSPWNMPLCQQ